MAIGSMALVAWLAWAPSAQGPAPARGNTVVAKRQGLAFTVVAGPRIGGLLAGGATVVQPVGVGGSLAFRMHGLHLGPLRLGIGADFGHTRYLERRQVQGEVDGQLENATRYAALGHSDFSVGPSLQLVLGPIFLQADASVGLGISTFSRPLGVLTVDEDHHSDVSAMMRVGGQLGIPIRNNQGFTVGGAMHRYFSTYQLVAEPDPNPDVEQETDTNPFDVMIEASIGYLFMF